MSKLKKKTRKNRKSHKNRTSKGGGRTPTISPTGLVSCSICEHSFPRNETLVPARCLKEHGERAHRICKKCWWNKFAREDAPHGCPGCIRGLPLTPRVKSTRKPTSEEIFVISDS